MKQTWLSDMRKGDYVFMRVKEKNPNALFDDIDHMLKVKILSIKPTVSGKNIIVEVDGSRFNGVGRKISGTRERDQYVYEWLVEPNELNTARYDRMLSRRNALAKLSYVDMNKLSTPQLEKIMKIILDN